jgi:tocopherol cyclase
MGVLLSMLNALLALCCLHFCEALATLSKLPPHAGYHGAGADPRKPFFEGWYLRLTTRNQGSIALIFHVFDAHTSKPSERQGVGMQIVSPSGTAYVESSDISTFRADSHDLEIRNFFPSSSDYFRLTSSRASGRISSSGEGSVAADFDFDIFPLIGWGGGDDSRQYSTAGWLAAFPVFEPHYQVLISKGRAEGSLSIRDSDGQQNIYDLTDATVYLEKNWGGSFPSKWWWIQANTFPSGLCVTSTGGRRRVPFLKDEEEVALIGLHYKGEFLPFPAVTWTVEWGRWQVQGSYEDYSVRLEGTCDEAGLPVRCPTPSGMEETAHETFRGTLSVKLYKRGYLIVEDSTSEACLEVGGLPWSSRIWTGESVMKEPLKSVVMNVEYEKKASDLLQLASAFVEIPGL